MFPVQPVEAFPAPVTKKEIQPDFTSLGPPASNRSSLKNACEARNSIDCANFRGSYVQAERLVSGVRREQFATLTRK